MSENNARQLHALAREVAAHLGFEWAYQAQQAVTHLAYLSGPNGSTMVLSFDRPYGTARRLEVSGRYPDSVQTHHGHVSFYPHGGAPRITLSSSRSARDVARDVARRFVAAYLAAYEKSVVQRERCLAEMAQEQACNGRLAAALGLKGSESGVSFYRSTYPDPGPSTFGSLETSLYGGSPNVKMELHGVPFETALAIAALLAPLTRGEGAST